MARNNIKRKGTGRKTIAILVDGETEKWYLDMLRSILNGYEKTEKYFIEKNPDIYKRLRPHLVTALKNAPKRGDFDVQNPETAKAEMYKLFHLLGLKIQ